MRLHDIEVELLETDVVYTFSGIVTYNLLTTSSTALRTDLEKLNGTSTKLRNLYAVITEMFQNIMNYSSKTKFIDGKDIGIGTCVVRLRDDGYIVLMGNQIFKKDEIILKDKLDKIRSLDKDGIKAYYKDVRRSGRDMHSQGAGLGFLEIAKKSVDKLEYHFTNINDDYSYFELKILI